MDTIIDLFDENDLKYSDDIIEINKNESYYIGKAEFALKQLDGHYGIYLKTILKNFHTLKQEEKDEIIDFLNIPEKIKIVTKVKIVYKEKKTKTKAKLNDYDDY
jgi:hypothetical protein